MASSRHRGRGSLRADDRPFVSGARGRADRRQWQRPRSVAGSSSPVRCAGGGTLVGVPAGSVLSARAAGAEPPALVAKLARLEFNGSGGSADGDWRDRDPRLGGDRSRAGAGADVRAPRFASGRSRARRAEARERRLRRQGAARGRGRGAREARALRAELEELGNSDGRAPSGRAAARGSLSRGCGGGDDVQPWLAARRAPRQPTSGVIVALVGELDQAGERMFAEVESDPDATRGGLRGGRTRVRRKSRRNAGRAHDVAPERDFGRRRAHGESTAGAGRPDEEVPPGPARQNRESEPSRNKTAELLVIRRR